MHLPSRKEAETRHPYSEITPRVWVEVGQTGGCFDISVSTFSKKSRLIAIGLARYYLKLFPHPLTARIVGVA
jgi:hypothetical protein